MITYSQFHDSIAFLSTNNELVTILGRMKYKPEYGMGLVAKQILKDQGKNIKVLAKDLGYDVAVEVG